MSVVPTSIEGNVKILFSVPARLVWTKPAKKERLSHVSQAARFLLDEVDMEVDENIISAGKLAESESSEAADKEERSCLWGKTMFKMTSRH